MKKTLVTILLCLAASWCSWAGGAAETGRSEAIGDVEEGQILSVGAVDPASYLEDFAFEKTNTSADALLVSVDLLRTQVWDKGDDLSVRIALVSNGRPFYRSVAGNFIMLFQNPELLRDASVQSFLKGLVTREPDLALYFFDPAARRLRRARDAAALTEAMRSLVIGSKVYEGTQILQSILEATRDTLGGQRNHILWVTDENLIEKSADAAFFHFCVSTLGGTDTTFSYLGYGERPNWPILNQDLARYNGNSYFAADVPSILQRITDDIGYFARPAVRDVKIEIVWSTFVRELPVYYPPEYYPAISTFYPTVNNSRPMTVHSIGGMNYGEDKRFIHYVKVPSRQEIEEKSFHDVLPNGRLKLGTVYFRYVVPMTGQTIVKQIDMVVDYQNDAAYIPGRGNPFVIADTLIQNTPLILLEVANLVNKSRNYLAAIQLVEAQRLALKSILSTRKDPAVDQDIKMLDGYFTLLFSQAKTLKLVQ